MASTSDAQAPGARLYVGGLHPETQTEEIFTLFKTFGTVTARVMHRPGGTYAHVQVCACVRPRLRCYATLLCPPLAVSAVPAGGWWGTGGSTESVVIMRALRADGGMRVGVGAER